MQIIEGYLYEHVGCTDYHSEIQTAGDDPADYEGGERSNNTPGDGFGEVTFWFNWHKYKIDVEVEAKI